jgi:hypothetical protein
MMSILQYARMLASALIAVFLAAVVAELPPIQALHQSVQSQHEWWLMTAVATVAVGFILMMGGILNLLMAQGRELNHEEAEDVERSVRMARWPVTWRATSYKVQGTAIGREGSDQFSFRDMKEAWRRGAWKRESIWRRRYATAVGAMILFVGICGVIFVVSPPAIKVLTSVAFFYTLFMTSRGLWKA